MPGGNQPLVEPLNLFITWTTYGTWLPGDSRGWRKQKAGDQVPQPLLEDWCRARMKEKAVLLTTDQRNAVEQVIHKHSRIRGWNLHAVSVRSNHVHVAITAAAPPAKVRDQLKANATRALRQLNDGVKNERVWTRLGDIQLFDKECDLQHIVKYVLDAQDRMDREK